MSAVFVCVFPLVSLRRFSDPQTRDRLVPPEAIGAPSFACSVCVAEPTVALPALVTARNAFPPLECFRATFFLWGRPCERLALFQIGPSPADSAGGPTGSRDGVVIVTPSRSAGGPLGRGEGHFSERSFLVLVGRFWRVRHGDSAEGSPSPLPSAPRPLSALFRTELRRFTLLLRTAIPQRWRCCLRTAPTRTPRPM